MAILKELGKLTLPGLVKTGYDKFRKQRAEGKEQAKTVKSGQKMAIKKEELAAKSFKTGQKGIEDILAGKGAPRHELGDLQRRMERAGEGAEKFFAPIQQRAERDFSQRIAPEIVSQYGGGAKSSSALNQALASARGQLSENVAADLAAYKQNYAGNLVNMSQQGKLQGLQSRLQASTSAIGQPSAYTPPLQMPQSSLQQYGPLATGVLGGIGGGIVGGPGGAVTGFQGGTAIGQTLFR